MAGDSLAEIALAVFALGITNQSALAFGTVLGMAMLPRVFFGWIVGGVIDRWHKRRLLVFGDVARAGLVLTIPLFHSYWWALAAVFIIQFIAMFYGPAVRAILPETVKPGQVNQANSLLGTAGSIINVLGYGLAGALIGLIGTSSAFAADAITFVVSAVFVLMLRLPGNVWNPLSESGQGFWRNIRDGVRYNRDNQVVSALFWVVGLGSLSAYSLNVLAAVIVHRLLNRPTVYYGLLLTAIASGMAVGSWFLQRFGPRLSYRKWMSGGFVIFGVMTILSAYSYNLIVTTGIFVLVGLANAFCAIPIHSWLMEVTPVEFRGRVFAARGMIISISATASVESAGLLAKSWGLGPTLWIYGVLSLLTAFLAFFHQSLSRNPVPGVSHVPGS